MALPPAIQENPQYGVGQFGANAAFDGLLGLRYAWGTTFGLVLPNIDEALARLSKGGGLGGASIFGPNFNLFSSASLKMLEEIGHGLTHTQAAASERYVTEAWAFEGIGAVIERVAEDAVHTRKLIRRANRPREVVRVVQPNIRVQLRPVIERAAQAEARAEAAERTAAQLAKRLGHLERQVAHANDGIVVGLPPRVGLGEREREQIKAGLRKVSKYGTLAFFLALLAKALEKMGASWIRCRNNKRWGSHVCRNGSSFLSDLIAATSLLVATYSLIEFAETMQAGVGEAASASRFFWQVR